MGVSGSFQGEKMAPLQTGRVVYAAPAAASTTVLKAATNITALSQTLTTFTQPVVPRNVVLTLVDTGVSITGGTMTVVGIDQTGKHVSESHTVTGAGTYTGSVAFAFIMSVVCAFTGAVAGGGDETVATGVGNKHGLPIGVDCVLVDVFKELHNNADGAVGTVDRTYATVTPTSASNADHNQEWWFTYKAKVPLS